VLVMLLTAVLPAAAEPSRAPATAVLLLDDAPREGLVDALRIQLPPGTRVVVRRGPGGTTSEDRARDVFAVLAATEGAVLALWLEPHATQESGLDVVVHLALRGRSSAEVVRVAAHRSEEADRAIALKARELIDARPPPESPPAAGAAVDERAEAGGTQAPGGVGLSPALEVGGFFATPSSGAADPQIGGQAAIGLAARGEPWVAEGLFLARLPTRLSEETDAGSVDVREVALAGTVRLLWAEPGSRFALGGFAGMGGRLLDAAGTTPAGVRGRADRVVPFVAVGPEVRVELIDGLRLRGAAAFDGALSRQRFTVNGQPGLDVAGVRGVAEVGVVATPF
jgi:hypothetical protein